MNLQHHPDQGDEAAPQKSLFGRLRAIRLRQGYGAQEFLIFPN